MYYGIIPKPKEIRKVRLMSGLSLRDLAIEARVHYSTISNIENAKGYVSPKTAKAICSALNMKFDDLFEIVEKGSE